MQKGTRAVPGKQNASVVELVVDNSKIVAKLNIANQRKKLWLLAGIGSGQKKVLMAQRKQHFFKYMEFLLTRNNVCKRNIEGRERGCRRSLYRGTKNFWQCRWKTAISHFNTKHLVLWTTPKTLESQWKSLLKELGIRSGLHSQTIELSRIKYFHGFVSSLNCLSYRCKQ